MFSSGAFEIFGEQLTREKLMATTHRIESVGREGVQDFARGRKILSGIF